MVSRSTKSASPVICIGRSHAKALVKAAEEDGRDFVNLAGKDVVDDPFEPGDEEPRKLRPEIADVLSGGAPVLCSVGGNAHTGIALIRHPRPFDFYLPEDPALPIMEDVDIVPAGAMQMNLLQRMGQNLDLLRAIAACATGPVYQAESPPPPGDDAYIEQNIDEFYKDRVSEGLNSAVFRYKIWRLNTAGTRAFCENLGMTFLPHPKDSVDENGYLKTEYCANATHGNAEYGRLVWRDLEARL